MVGPATHRAALRLLSELCQDGYSRGALCGPDGGCASEERATCSAARYRPGPTRPRRSRPWPPTSRPRSPVDRRARLGTPSAPRAITCRALTSPRPVGRGSNLGRGLSACEGLGWSGGGGPARLGKGVRLVRLGAGQPGAAACAAGQVGAAGQPGLADCSVGQVGRQASQARPRVRAVRLGGGPVARGGVCGGQVGRRASQAWRTVRMVRLGRVGRVVASLSRAARSLGARLFSRPWRMRSMVAWA